MSPPVLRSLLDAPSPRNIMFRLLSVIVVSLIVPLMRTIDFVVDAASASLTLPHGASFVQVAPAFPASTNRTWLSSPHVPSGKQTSLAHCEFAEHFSHWFVMVLHAGSAAVVQSPFTMHSTHSPGGILHTPSSQGSEALHLSGTSVPPSVHRWLSVSSQ
jgi:hypothetical protein